MPSPTIAWRPESAWTPFASAGRGGASVKPAGVRIDLLPPGPLATLIARDGKEEALATALREAFECDLPPSGRAGIGERAEIVWSGPAQWLVVGASLDASLRDKLADVAAVTDQSGSRALLDVSGPRARDALAKGFAIDLHPSVFTTGHAAATAVTHMSVQIWQVDDAPRYRIAVPRSFASSFWSWLVASCAAYGYEVAEAA